MWTRAKIKKAIKTLISRGDLVIRERDLKYDTACSTWRKDGEDIVIFCDLHRDGLVSSVIHELCHIVLEKDLENFTYTVEEWMVSGIEKELYQHIQNSPTQLNWWRKAIERRLK